MEDKSMCVEVITKNC